MTKAKTDRGMIHTVSNGSDTGATRSVRLPLPCGEREQTARVDGMCLNTAVQV